MVKWKGAYFLPYRRLRISALTDEIARLITRLLEFDDDCSELVAIRSLVRAWREHNFADYTGKGKDTVNEFLYTYDFKYRVRRLSFLRHRIDRLCRMDSHMQEELKGIAEAWKTLKSNPKFRKLNESQKKGLYRSN